MAHSSHKRDTNARRTPSAAKLAAPLAVFATLASVGVGVITADAETPAPASANKASFAELAIDREEQVSRAASRTDLDPRATAEDIAARAQLAATRLAVRNATKKLWTTEDLNLWDSAAKTAKQVGTIAAGKQVLVTGRRDAGRAEIVVADNARWVTAAYLTAEKPVVGIGGACTNGSSVPGGVSPNIKKVHQAVCAAFPDITSYGTFRGDGEHSQGIAIDIMVSGARGYAVRDFLRKHYAALGISYIIYSQQMWSVERGGEGWRGMSDRGSATANHYDHVHVTTF